MRAASLLVIFFLACNGSTGPSKPAGKQDAAPEPEPEADAAPEPEPEADAAPAEPDAFVMGPDAPIPTADAPVVVTPSMPGPDTTVSAFMGTPVYWLGGMDNKRT